MTRSRLLPLMEFIVRRLLRRRRKRRFRLERGCWWPSRELDEKHSQEILYSWSGWKNTTANCFWGSGEGFGPVINHVRGRGRGRGRLKNVGDVARGGWCWLRRRRAVWCSTDRKLWSSLGPAETRTFSRLLSSEQFANSLSTPNSRTMPKILFNEFNPT